MSVKNTKVNKSFGKTSGIFGLKFEYLVPLALSIIVGFSITLLMSLNYIWLFIHCLWPFLTWVVVAGQHPGRFLAKGIGVPRWQRGAAKRLPQFGRTNFSSSWIDNYLSALQSIGAVLFLIAVICVVLFT